MASRLLQSSDLQAPQLLGGSAGSLITVLKAVLVNGYGATPGLGWTLEYENILTKVAVFRMGGGTRTYIRVQDDLTAGYAKVTAYQEMTSADIGYFPCPDPGLSAYNNILKGTGTTVNTGWKVIGDEKGFYFLDQYNLALYPTNPDLNGYWQPHYIGDYIPFDLNNRYNFCMQLSYISLVQLFKPLASGVSSFVMIMRNPKTNAPASLLAGISSFSPDANATAFGNMNVSFGPVNGRNVYSKPVLMMSSGGVHVLGELPGMLNPLQMFPTVIDYATVTPRMDVCNDNQVFLFPFQSASGGSFSGGYIQRLGIIVGDNFRNAY